MRWAGEVEVVRRDLVMGALLIAGTGMPRLRKGKAPSSLFYMWRLPQARASSHALFVQ
jgi:hypothetical protein